MGRDHHARQDEAVLVLEGRLRVHLRDAEVTAGPEAMPGAVAEAMNCRYRLEVDYEGVSHLC